MTARYALRFGALGYLTLLLLVPVGLVFYRTFEHGIGHVIDSVTTPAAISAFWLTIEVAAIAVPLNTVFGIVLAIALVRHRFPGRGLVNAIVDLPLALSPVVVGLSLYLLYGTGGWLSGLSEHGIKVLFSLWGMTLATIFVSLPFVVREVVPVLREIGTDQEQAAETLGAAPFTTFRRITGGRVRGRSHDRARDRRVRRGQRRLGADRGQDGDLAALRAVAVRGVQHHRSIRGLGRPGADRARNGPGNAPVPP
jgi:sulfate/thiosulfate transport system permease protein